MSIPWTAFYWSDYLRDTAHLSLAEHGAYLLLMAHYYSTAKPLPANAEQLHRICRCMTDADREAINSVVTGLFIRNGSCYRHKRIDLELSKASQLSEKRSLAARSKGDSKSQASAEQLLTQSQSQSQSQKKNLTSNPKPLKTPPEETPVNGLHGSIRKAIQETFADRYQMPCPWDESEGAALKKMLKSNPSWTKEHWSRMLTNLFDSDGITGQRPRQWLPVISQYAAGPLDRFGKVKA